MVEGDLPTAGYPYCMIGLCLLWLEMSLVWLEMSLVWLEMSLVWPEITVGLIKSIHRCVRTQSHLYSYIYVLVALLDNIQSSFSKYHYFNRL